MRKLPNAGLVVAEPTIALQRRVMIAATVGTVIEWYDFFMYISVASAISANFFSSDNPVWANVFALLTFATGYLVRPFGALVFGRIGDMIGRKHTFLTTILMMGFATVAVGLVPSYAAIGLWAPSILILLRMIQGLALGGEYGGAATYIAEHAPQGRRGWLTSWLQTSAPIGFTLSMLSVYFMRSSMSPEAFNGWGWRLLFISSVFPLAISVWIRLKLQESPLFLKMKKEGTLSKSPIYDTLAAWPNLKRVLIAMFAMVVPQSVLLVGAQIYSLVFLTGTAKVDPQIANLLVGAALMLTLPAMIFFGWLSDRYGTKIFVLAACVIGTMTYVPLYKALTFYANPALYNAQTAVPVTVAADPSECSFQFNPIGTTKFTTGCDIAKNALIRFGAPYSNRSEANGAIATVFVGPKAIPVGTAGQAPDVAAFTANLKQALEQSGYPSRADTNAMNFGMIILVLVALSTIAGMIFGPLASAMTDLFPPQVRYTSVSFSYHVGNGYFGGLLPAIATALQIATGDIYAGLYYVIIVSAIAFFLGLFWLHSPQAVAKIESNAAVTA
ncbi:MHS family MFS transporter [Bradyrhizobium sp. INPA01-394B]|uniref:MFS transporter n=1 Tax=Bradyrhizobium campsiandrae TaxID=1729892 RepID=A0ABR7UDN5_9BRAD|nr:MFS transporter [Bradyrhizobium campsiandrae]MBC9880703.1 MHS family MFS transporter [Bradyrhizobium campsiandrae]MBC9982220.1 MFS transporter [Bradyrhizobium campsiandrae]